MTAPTAPSSALAFASTRESLTGVVRFLHRQGWTPATSSNFSVRTAPASSDFWISVSGLDKGALTSQDYLRVDAQGQVMDPEASHLRPSAETLLHSLIYRMDASANTVLHCHSVNGTVLSKLYEAEQGLWLHDFEILKGLEGICTHEARIWLPIFANSQDMPSLAAQIEEALLLHSPVYGFLLAGHGLYTWGETPAQARRHVEVFEFLFEAVLKLRSYGYFNHS